MEFIVMDEKNGDIFNKEFGTEQQAIEYASSEWERMSEHDKKHCDEYYVLKSANPDEEAENHFDGNVVLKFK